MKSSPPDLAIIIPALNERENLKLLLPALNKVLAELDLSADIIVVDGGSHDGTQTAALSGGARVVTQTERGYGGALIAGFKAAVQTVVVTMDADLSHAPDFLADLWRHRNRAEVIIASRYMKDGTADISRLRLVLSRILNFVYSRRLALPIQDLSSGFRLYHRTVLSGLVLQARDFDVLEEILVKSYVRGFRICEIPFRYMRRASGSSHIRPLAFAWSFIKTLRRLHSVRFPQQDLAGSEDYQMKKAEILSGM